VGAAPGAAAPPHAAPSDKRPPSGAHINRGSASAAAGPLRAPSPPRSLARQAAAINTSQPASPAPPSRSGMPGSPSGDMSPWMPVAAASQPAWLLPADPRPAGRLPTSALAAHRPPAAAPPQPASQASRAPATARTSAAAVKLPGRRLRRSRRAPSRLAASRLDAGLRQGLSGPALGLPASRAAEGELAAVRDDADEPDVRRGKPHGRTPLHTSLRRSAGSLSTYWSHPSRCAPSTLPAQQLGSAGNAETVQSATGFTTRLAPGRRLAVWRFAADGVEPAPGLGPWRVRRVQRGAQRIAAAVRAAHGGWPAALVSLASARQGPAPGAADRQANSCALARKLHTLRGTQARQVVHRVIVERQAQGQTSGAGVGRASRHRRASAKPAQLKALGGDALQRTPADKRHPDAGINLIRYEGLG